MNLGVWSKAPIATRSNTIANRAKLADTFHVTIIAPRFSSDEPVHVSAFTFKLCSKCSKFEPCICCARYFHFSILNIVMPSELETNRKIFVHACHPSHILSKNSRRAHTFHPRHFHIFARRHPIILSYAQCELSTTTFNFNNNNNTQICMHQCSMKSI